MKSHPLFGRINRLLHWLAYGKFHIASISAIIVMWLYLFRIIKSGSNVVSLIMILIGLAAILSQLILDAKAFSYHEPNTPAKWIRAFPKKNIVIKLLTGEIKLTGGNIHAYKRGVTRPGDPLETKVDYLIHEVDNLHLRIEQARKQISEVDKNASDRINELNIQIGALDRTTKNLIAGHAVGDFAITLFGIVSAFCGTIIQFFCT